MADDPIKWLDPAVYDFDRVYSDPAAFDFSDTFFSTDPSFDPSTVPDPASTADATSDPSSEAGGDSAGDLAGALFGLPTFTPPGNRRGGINKPQIPRDPRNDRRQGRNSDLTSEIINSLLFKGLIYANPTGNWWLQNTPMIADRPPNGNDDFRVGADPGVFWLDTAHNALYVNKSSALGAAVWLAVVAGTATGPTGTFTSPFPP